MKNCYSIMGYDKDVDAYETLCSSPYYERAVDMARCIMHYHMEVRKLCRTKTGEPFDWFMVMRGNEPVMMFTTDEPEGTDTIQGG